MIVTIPLSTRHGGGVLRRKKTVRADAEASAEWQCEQHEHASGCGDVFVAEISAAKENFDDKISKKRKDARAYRSEDEPFAVSQNGA